MWSQMLHCNMVIHVEKVKTATGALPFSVASSKGNVSGRAVMEEIEEVNSGMVLMAIAV